ncbi:MULTISPECIES: siderophore-interacting protein [Microbacterium]|uniref:siderophore-interacting protein n=1 Tax=Microbacterium TaxID=33882 RepID=UPI0027864FA0|nr:MULTISPECIES: siderophore-interacting protein [Microbacterium]MDQ1084753.1 NADPH-dependent ferric siderophore reductase [Microbacterium sp. SORGH_AS_0344]MDQ1169968.1 NADPH-dependent ferric siderophore reductase [Microbacterium proteolyticum]
MTDRPVRPPRPQHVLHVVATERLSPHLVRIRARGDDLAAFRESPYTDKYVKITFTKPELGLEPPYDLAVLRQTLRPEDLPVTRTYTVRAVDGDELAIDFVVHGDDGLAGPWAARARVGDRLVVSSPGGAYAPDPAAAWHLFVGDESAIPAIAASLESLAPDAVGAAFLEVQNAGEQLALSAPAGIEIVWVHRGAADAGATPVLAEAVAAWHPLDGRGQVFAHGERESMKALRDIVFTRWGLARDQVSLSGYWAYGRTEDRFQAEKREPIGQII